MKKVLFFFFILASLPTMAQLPNMGGRSMNVGRFYGKILDSISGKGIEYAVVQLHGTKFDSVSKTWKPAIITGQLTNAAGEFSLENLTPFGSFTLKITALGYKPMEMKVAFNLDFSKMNQGGGGREGNWSSALNSVDKDLGNIRLSADVKTLNEVEIDGGQPDVELKIDRKVYNVEKNLTAMGGNAQDALKNVPSVNVDLDGNVTLRNASPQIFIDGRPTTLSLDQIPADAIQSIEVITNPNAKFDASGGGGGIINIVLKKNRKPGYNGSIRAGFDSRIRGNFGGDLNVREGKLNVFVSGFLNQRKSKSFGETTRDEIMGDPKISFLQENLSTTNGFFGMGRFGADYFVNLRNTITLTGIYVMGSFNPLDELFARTDSNYSSYSNYSTYDRFSDTQRDFDNMGLSLQTKKLFPKAGKELTTDINYNNSSFTNTSEFKTNYYNSSGTQLGPSFLQKQVADGGNVFYTAQVDFVNPIGEKMKIETGARAAVRDFISRNDNYQQNFLTGEYQLLKNQNGHYHFVDQVYAGYGIFSHQVKKISYQAGVRVESSFYFGELLDSNVSFTNSFPLSLFPSGALTYQKNSKSDFQFNFARRINRPNFFQLIPFTDYSDSLNLSRGNAALTPEFTLSTELSYLHTFSRGNSLMLTAFYRHSTDLITRYQVREFDTVLNRNAIINTFQNADESYAYGLEATIKYSPKKWFEFSLNGNVYQSVIDATNIDPGLENEQFSWNAKGNITFKLPKDFQLQFNGDYQSRMALPLGGGDGWRRYGGGGMHWGGSSTSSVQGYMEPNWSLDAGIKWSFWKEKRGSLSLNINDIFRTKYNITYTESPFFVQRTSRIRDPQIVRLNFNYRFGKFDVSLFKRKNMKMNTEGMDMGM
jgi:outer membrane receptor protein involved in Fe transport